ncbi:unnamed protein product [Ixodes pacificus]
MHAQADTTLSQTTRQTLPPSSPRRPLPCPLPRHSTLDRGVLGPSDRKAAKDKNDKETGKPISAAGIPWGVPYLLPRRRQSEQPTQPSVHRGPTCCAKRGPASHSCTSAETDSQTPNTRNKAEATEPRRAALQGRAAAVARTNVAAATTTTSPSA